MNQKNLKELIKKLVQEYGTGDAASTGLTSDDGNNVTSQRSSFHNEDDEMNFYLNQNKGNGGDGGHYTNEPATSGLNRDRSRSMWELQNMIKKVIEELDEDAYGHATLTTQGGKALRGFGVQEDEEFEFDDASQETSKFTSPLGEDKEKKLNEDEMQALDRSDYEANLTLHGNQVKRVEYQIDQAEDASQQAFNQASLAIDQAGKALKDAQGQLKDTLGQQTVLRDEHDELKEKEFKTPEDIQRIDITIPQELAQLEKTKKDLRRKLPQLKKSVSTAQTGRNLANQGASSGIDSLEKNLIDLRKNKPPKPGTKQTKENKIIMKKLLENYIKLRKNKNLMDNMDYYKREFLLENAMKNFFKLFDEGKTDEEVLRRYAEQGVVVPETFVKKARDQHKKLKQEKLDIENLEQETKGFKEVSKVEEEPEVEEKVLSTKLYQQMYEGKIREENKRYHIPSEIRNTLENTLKMYPLIRFVKNLKAVNSIPPSYRVFLLNNQHSDIIYEDYSLMVKIGTKEFYMGDIEGRNYAIKYINKLMTEPIMSTDEEGLEGDVGDIIDKGKGGGGGAPPLPPPPPPPPPPKPEDEA